MSARASHSSAAGLDPARRARLRELAALTPAERIARLDSLCRQLDAVRDAATGRRRA